jgi:hypothetical protein
LGEHTARTFYGGDIELKGKEKSCKVEGELDVLWGSGDGPGGYSASSPVILIQTPGSHYQLHKWGRVYFCGDIIGMLPPSTSFRSGKTGEER